MQIYGWLSVGLTYLLMVMTNLDLPLKPQLSGFDWSYRTLAFLTAGFIVVTLYQTFKPQIRKNATLKRSGKFLVTAIAFQIVIDGGTFLISHFLQIPPSAWLNAFHWASLVLIFSGLIATASSLTWAKLVIEGVSPKVQRLSGAAVYALFIQLFLGIALREHQSGLACPNFPHCLDEFLPSPWTLDTALAFFHRWWGILLLGLFVHLTLAAAKKKPVLLRIARLALGLCIAQILLGVGTIHSRLNISISMLHAAVGFALWGCLFFIALRSGAIRWLR
jgi:heme A synthase